MSKENLMPFDKRLAVYMYFVSRESSVPAGADEDTEATAAIQEINRAIGMLGDACEANIFGADEQAYFWDDAHTRYCDKS
jgi:hypothetical protein